jgi:hypothetical protein
MSVSDKFKTFCLNLRIEKDVVDRIAYRYKRITKQLNASFWGIASDERNSLYVGSYGRDTDIKTSDIDMLFQLPYDVYNKYHYYAGNGQSALLQEVKRAIQKTYSFSTMRADGQVIKIDFSDGIIFELVPCFSNTDGSFKYPDTNNGGRWRTTNPKPEIKAIREGNLLCNYNLKRLCRMARAWKYQWNVPMGSLLIDTLAYQFMKSWVHRNESFLYYDFMTRDFFQYLNNQNSSQKYWLAPGSHQYVWRKNSKSFGCQALRCFNISLEAIQHEVEGRNWSANQKWREIYGTQFPFI